LALDIYTETRAKGTRSLRVIAPRGKWSPRKRDQKAAEAVFSVRVFLRDLERPADKTTERRHNRTGVVPLIGSDQTVPDESLNRGARDFSQKAQFARGTRGRGYAQLDGPLDKLAQRLIEGVFVAPIGSGQPGQRHKATDYIGTDLKAHDAITLPVAFSAPAHSPPHRM
jgi:hypothetical protein